MKFFALETQPKFPPLPAQTLSFTLDLGGPGDGVPSFLSCQFSAPSNRPSTSYTPPKFIVSEMKIQTSMA